VLILPIKLLVGEIGEKDDSVVDKDSATAVLVNPRACVERSGCYIMMRAAPHVLYQYRPSTFFRSVLDPIDVFAINKNIDQPDRIRCD
jgi:hypothetical protein